MKEAGTRDERPPTLRFFACEKDPRDFPEQEHFHWQAVSYSNLGKVRQYLARQEEHHRRLSFQEEFIAFLKRHRLDYDERYLWD